MAQVNEKKLLKKRSKKVLEFFFKIKSKSIVITLFVLLAFVSSSAFTANKDHLTIHYILGSLSIVAFVIFLLAILRAFNNKLTADELEEIFAMDRQTAFDGLFKNFAINNNKEEYIGAPIELTCPEVYPGRKTIVYRYDKKRSRVYYSQTGYSWLFFGPKRLFYYHVSINHVYGFVGYEVASEVDYKNIVHVKSESTFHKGQERITLYLSLVNGDVINVVLRSRPTKVYESSHELSELEELILGSIRKNIRENN